MEKITLKLSAAEINSKVFDGKNGGYDSLQVDRYLDMVVNDYIAFEKLLNSYKRLLDSYNGLQKTCDNYRTKLSDSEYQKAVVQDKLRIMEENGGGTSNIELLQRISLLEQALYKLGKDPSKIK